MDGTDLVKMANSPEEANARISVSTFGRGNYVLAQNSWRYIHYFDGSEELYNLESDPDQFTNLADDEASAKILENLRSSIPDNSAISWMARMEKYKLVRYKDGSSVLVDLTDPRGVTDAGNISADNPDVVKKIEQLRKKNGITGKYCDVLAPVL